MKIVVIQKFLFSAFMKGGSKGDCESKQRIKISFSELTDYSPNQKFLSLNSPLVITIESLSEA